MFLADSSFVDILDEIVEYSIMFLPTILFGLFLIVLIEVAQLISRRGWFELCDIVDNTIGVMIGYTLYRIGEVVWRRSKC